MVVLEVEGVLEVFALPPPPLRAVGCVAATTMLLEEAVKSLSSFRDSLGLLARPGFLRFGALSSACGSEVAFFLAGIAGAFSSFPRPRDLRKALFRLICDERSDRIVSRRQRIYYLIF